METIHIGPQNNLKLTRGERFKDARLGLPKPNTMKVIQEATGVSESMITDLENDASTRDVGFSNIAKLAKHYGVSADWLLGLTDAKHSNPAAVDDLGITEAAVDVIRGFRFCTEELKIFSSIVSSYEFWRVIQSIKTLREQAQRMARDYSLSRDMDVRTSTSDAAKRLRKDINQPFEILVGDDYVDHIEHTIVKNLEQIIHKEIERENKQRK